MSKYSSLKNPEFILLGGYKFSELEIFQKKIKKKYNVIAVNTGKYTNTAGRLLKIKDYIKDDYFFLTYGDTITDYNPKSSLKKKNQSVICLHSYNVPYGVINVKNKKVAGIYEKNFPVLVNAGHYYLNPLIFKYIKNKDQSFEKDILPKLINDKSFNFGYLKLKRWYPIDNKFDLDNYKKVN
jgi:glucose-1-phosphate cytidylyltransferase